MNDDEPTPEEVVEAWTDLDLDGWSTSNAVIVATAILLPLLIILFAVWGLRG